MSVKATTETRKKCLYCGGTNLEERARGKTGVMYDHAKCDVMYDHAKCEDCGQVIFLTDSRRPAYCGSQAEHWQRLAVNA